HQGDQHQLVEKESGDHGTTPLYKCSNEGIVPGFQTTGISRRLEVHIWTRSRCQGLSNGQTRFGTDAAIYGPARAVKGSRMDKHASGQMQPYIRPLSEDIPCLRALMKSALPRLITTSASRALYLRRLGGSRSDRSRHQLVHTSPCAERLLDLSVTSKSC